MGPFGGTEEIGSNKAIVPIISVRIKENLL